MALIHRFEDGDHPVELHQYRSTGRFRVQYGTEVHRHLEYAEAAKHYGECVMHSLTCAGKIETPAA